MPSTAAELLFCANGIDDVVLRLAPLSGVFANAVHNQLWGINAFELTQISNVPEPATLSLLGLGAVLALRRRRKR